MNTTARRAVASLALIGTGLAAAACSSGADEDTLTVCTNVPFAPFESLVDGEYVGLDMDLMNLLAERLDRSVEVVEIDFDSIQSGSALNAGTCDIAAAGISITDERQNALGMSQPYYRADQALVVPEGSDIAAQADLGGARVAVQSATTGADYAESIKDEYGFEPVAFDTMGDIATALTSGQADASIADLATWTEMVQVADGLAQIETIETEEYYAFAVAKNDTDLLGEVDAMLDAAFDDGDYAAIYEEWIGEPYTGDLTE